MIKYFDSDELRRLLLGAVPARGDVRGRGPELHLRLSAGMERPQLPGQRQRVRKSIF